MLALHGISGRIDLVSAGIRYFHHFLVRHHRDLGDRIDINADKVLGRYVAVCLDIDGNLPQKKPVQTIDKGKTQTRMPDQDFLSSGTGNDEGGIRRCLHITDQDQGDDGSDHNCCRNSYH